jgi:3-deoxy-D-manno-octulosonic-acid transferase
LGRVPLEPLSAVLDRVAQGERKPAVWLVCDIAYLLLLIILSPWLLYGALRHGKYREGYAAKLWGRVPRREGQGPCIWLHAVSVGEVNLLQPLLEGIEQRFPDWECVISTTTKTGFELARRKYAPRCVFYCPLDFSWSVRRAVRRIRPDVLVLAELELWPNLLRAARRQHGRLAIVNGRLSDGSWKGYRRLRPIVATMLSQLDLIAVQNEEYASRFLQLGADRDKVHITGSLKFDGAVTDRDNPTTLRLARLAGIGPQDDVLLAGSTQEPEEALAVETFRELLPEFPTLRLILVPRHPTRCEDVAQLLDAAGMPWQRRSTLDSHGADPAARILLVDTVGELGGWWGTARIAFVGGSMGTRGGQNMIEPAAYGAAVAFGPNTRNFRDVVALLRQKDAAEVVRDGEQLTEFVRRCLEDLAWAQQRGRRAQTLVVQQRGATHRTLERLSELMCPAASHPKPLRGPLHRRFNRPESERRIPQR